MNIYKNKSKLEVRHMFYLRAKKAIPSMVNAFGMDISYILSNDYELPMANSSITSNEKKDAINTVRKDINYNFGEGMQSVLHLINGIRSHRKKLHRRSIGTEEYMAKFDIYKKCEEETKQVASMWWNNNNPRTSVQIRCEKDHLHGITKGSSAYSATTIDISPLWYHRVFKHGFSGVVYKGRPCFVMSVEPYPIRRLKEDNIDMYKVTILHSHNGEITMLDNMYLAVFKQVDHVMNSQGKVVKPSECILSVSPDLKRAETIVSQRIGRNVINNLLS